MKYFAHKKLNYGNFLERISSKNPKKHGLVLPPLMVYSALRYTGLYPHKINEF